MDKVSIILPVYNVEKYINKCLESICSQTYSNIEIILVIDGSKDQSEKIAYDWGKKDKRIIIIKQENMGSGVARNNGLSIATGKYVMFVDPDDWIEKQMVEVLVDEIKKIDADFLTTGCYNDYYDQFNKLLKSELDIFEKEFLKDINEIHKRYVPLLLNRGICAPTKKIYKLEIIKENNITFPSLRRSQDIVFNYRYFDCIKSMVISDSIHYHYRIEAETYQKKIHTNYYKTVCLMYSEIRTLLKKWNIELNKNDEQKFIKYFYNLIVWQISIGNSNSIMNDLVNNEVVLEIFSKSKPQGIKQIILKKLVVHQKDKLINFIISVLKKNK